MAHHRLRCAQNHTDPRVLDVAGALGVLPALPLHSPAAFTAETRDQAAS